MVTCENSKLLIGVLGAMKSEVSLIIDRLSDLKELDIFGFKFYVGVMRPAVISKSRSITHSSYKTVVVGLSGPGKVNAALCTYIMLTKFSPSVIINYGVVGAISSSLDIFDLVLSDRVVQADIDTSVVGDPIGLVSRINKVYFNSNSLLTSCMKNIISSLPSVDDVNTVRRIENREFSDSVELLNSLKGVGIYFEASSDSIVNDAVSVTLNYKKPGKLLLGDIATTDSFISSDVKKSDILSNFPDTLVCDMELGAIAQTCYASNVPFVSVKLISDNANSSANISYEEVLKYASSIGLVIFESLIFNADFIDILSSIKNCE